MPLIARPSRRGSKPGERRGGRQRGTRNKKTQALIVQATADGLTPIEVMIRNMRYWNEKAERVTQDFERMLAFATQIKNAKLAEKFMHLLEEMVSFRKYAQDCATDAAPYVHPRLAALNVQGDPLNPLLINHQHAVIEENDLRTRLLDRLARLGSCPEEGGLVIEHEPSGDASAGDEPSPEVPKRPNGMVH